MVNDLDLATARTLLEWQVEMGVDCALAAEPIDRFALPDRTATAPVKTAAAATNVPATSPPAASADPVTEAEAAAARAADLAALRDALARFPHCDLRMGATNLVFADGNPDARLMIIGEAPGREEDRAGRPFVGQAGQLLDRMFAAIGMARDADNAAQAFYITNVLPWRPPGNRDPEPAEVAMMLPFLRRHIDFVAPDLIVTMGNHACQAVLGRKGITKLRGQWTEGFGRPCLPMLHPAYLLRQPHAKRETWADLLELSARLS